MITTLKILAAWVTGVIVGQIIRLDSSMLLRFLLSVGALFAFMALLVTVQYFVSRQIPPPAVPIGWKVECSCGWEKAHRDSVMAREQWTAHIREDHEEPTGGIQRPIFEDTTR